MKILKLLFIIIFSKGFSLAAQTDSTFHSPLTTQADSSFHSPKKASIYSAVLPGLGQAYNKKYWKIPIVYAGLGACIYFFKSNNDEYQKTRKALIARLDTDSTTIDNTFTDPRYTDALLQDRKNYYRKNRDLSAIIGLLVYVANIIDADVDAHMMNFNVDDNLSLRVSPFIFPGGMKGIYLSMNF